MIHKLRRHYFCHRLILRLLLDLDRSVSRLRTLFCFLLLLVNPMRLLNQPYLQ